MARVILAHQDNPTASEALRRNGMARLVSGERLVALKGEVALAPYAWRSVDAANAIGVSGIASISSVCFGFAGRPSSIFGGLPCLKQAGNRMLTAPLTLDPSATQEEGGP